MARAEPTPVVRTDRVDLQRARPSMISVRVGNRSYPAKFVNTCRVCTHPARALIEERLLYNDTYPSIAAWVSEQQSETLDGAHIEWPPVTVPQLGGHYRGGHCPVDTQVLHELTEQRAAETGVNYEQSLGRIVDHVVLTQQIATRGQERLTRGEIAPDVKETLAAAKLLHDMQTSAAQAEVTDHLGAFQDALDIYFGEARRVMTSEQWTQFTLALTNNPVLREIAGRFQESNVVDAEIVE